MSINSHKSNAKSGDPCNMDRKAPVLCRFDLCDRWLRPIEQSIINLRFLVGLSTGEIAHLTNLRRGGVQRIIDEVSDECSCGSVPIEPVS